MNKVASMIFNSSEFGRIKDTELHILKIFDRICRDNGIRYFAVYGTLLGAVRNHGFIPWDDDVDVAIFREDVEKLQGVRVEDYDGNLVFWFSGDNEDYQNNVIKFLDKTTSFFNPSAFLKCGKYGIHIDVMIIDNTYAFPLFSKIKNLRLQSMFEKASSINYGYPNLKQYNRGNIEGIVKNIEEVLQKPNGNAKYCSVYSLNLYPLLKREWFEECVNLSFEDMEIPAPKGYRDVLWALYGEDYMELPKEEDRTPDHLDMSCFASCDIPYERAKHMIADALLPKADEKVYIWGAGNMFDLFMKDLNGSYMPVGIIDKNEALWGSEKDGIPICSPADFFADTFDNKRVVICNIYFFEIIRELTAHHIDNISVYWDGYFDWKRILGE